MLLRKLLLSACLLLFFVPVQAQPRYSSAFFQHLTVDDGLPENSVRAIVQDELGFLWFGTQAGLVRYDGYEMESSWHAGADSVVVPNLVVSALLEDEAGMLWIGTLAQGLWRVDPALELIEKIDCGSVAAGEQEQPVPAVTQLARSSDGSVWVAWDGNGLCRHELSGDCRQYLRHDPALGESLPSDRLNAVFEDHQGNLWVGTGDRGLGLRTAGTEGFRHFAHDPEDQRSIPHDQVNSFYQAPDGRIWVTTFDGLCSWLPRVQGFRSYRPDPERQMRLSNYLLNMDVAEGGGLWVGSAVGLYHFDPLIDEFNLYTHDPDDPHSPVKGPVLSVLRDRSGIVWAGSWHAGLNKLDPRAAKFGVLHADREDPRSLDDDAVMAIMQDSKGDLWVGTGSMSSGGSQGGLNRRIPGTDEFEQLPLPRSGPSSVRSVESLSSDPVGNLWIGTDHGLWYLASGSARPVRVHREDDANGEGVGDFGIRGLTIDREGELWVCAFGAGLYRIDPRSGARRHYAHDSSDPTTLSQNELIFVYEDSKGRIWVGGDTRGLNLYQPETDDFLRYHDSQGYLSSLVSMHEDTKGRLWIGSLGGLLLFDPALGVKEAITREQGLPHNLVGAILEDDRGRLWLSTGRGVARFDPDTGEIRAYDTRDGLPADEISFKGWRASDGEYWFGGNHGLIRFRPDGFRENEFAPNVVLTAMRIGDVPQLPGRKSVLEAGLPYSLRVDLTHEQNDLSISYAALDFTHPERNRYRYRLLDYDRDWREAGARRIATYTNLSPGDYRFEVQGSNSDGHWSSSIAAVDLFVSPPWWLTAWARALYLLAALMVIIAIYRQVVQRERIQAALQLKRSEAEQLHELDRFKSRFFANISHEFRTPLTLIQAPLQRLHKDPSGGDRVLFEMMTRNAHRLGELIDQLLDLSRLEAKRLPMRWRHGDWLAYLRTMLSSFDSLARSRKLEFSVEAPKDAPPAWYDADILEKLVSNLLSNAFRYTPDGGEVWVRVGTIDERAKVEVPTTSSGEHANLLTATANYLWLEVANSGSYIPPSEREKIFDRFHQIDSSGRGGSGIGLALVKELVDWMHGSIEVTSDRNSGTCFRLVLPLFQEPPVLGLEPAGEEDILQEEADSEEGLRAIAAAGGTDSDVEVEASGETPAAKPEAPLVLVVEDHAELRAFLVSGLSPRYRVMEAGDGAAGLSIATEQVPDLILSDVMMPHMDGVEMCERLKKDQRTNHIPVILLTAKVEIESRRAGLEVGADDYLAKPFDLEELQIRVKNLIEQRRRLAEKYASRVARLAPDAMPVTSADERFLARARKVVEEHLDDPELNVDTLCREIGLSRAQLHRKIKALTGYSTKEFVRIHRLQRAAALLKGRYGNVTEVAYAVGFLSLSYFSRAFREQYGVAPSEYPDRS